MTYYFGSGSDCIGNYQFAVETKETIVSRGKKKKASHVFKLSRRALNRINKKYGGFKMRKVLRVEQASSNSFYVVFQLPNGTLKRVNIIRQCREYCKKHGTRFTKQLRKELADLMPKKLNIFLLLPSNYESYCLHNGRDPWYRAMVDEDHLEEVWLKKMHI